MSKNGYYQDIIELIKKRPISQNEIRAQIGEDKISLQGVSKNLKRAIRLKEVAYFGNKVSKSDAKFLIKKQNNVDWAEDAHQMYVRTPESGKLFKKLKKRYGKDNLLLIDSICEKYRLLEISAKFQEMYYENVELIRRDFKAQGKDYSDENVLAKINSKKEELNDYYLKNKTDEFKGLISMTPIMFWIAFRDHPVYDSSKSVPLNVTQPMLNELRKLILLKRKL